jgi:phage shock protein PspC (stress-responsive transcriptional regulator)
MRKVVTISLNGNAYQIEEGGYEALRAYLEEAQAKLRADPDRSEIMADLEQAIADKCSQTLRPHKGVVTNEEVARILGEMGPVDGAPATGAAGAAQGGGSGQPAGADQSAAGAGTAGEAGDAGGAGVGSAAGAGAGFGAGGQAGTGQAGPAPKRLYQIREGAMISGVCNGIAAYFGFDVSVVRVIFVVLALLTWGLWALVYLALMFIIPYASTSEERAAAHGLPFNAQQLVEQWKKQYTSFAANSQHWCKKNFDRQNQRNQRRAERAQQRAWRREARQGRAEMRDYSRSGYYYGPHWSQQPDNSASSYAARVAAGVMVPIVAVINAALIVGLIVAIAQLVTTGMIFGWEPPPGIPLWLGIIILIVVYNVCAAPLHAIRHQMYYGQSPTANVWFAVWGSILWLGCMAFFFWLAYLYWPDLQHVLQQIGDSIRSHSTHVQHAPGEAASLLGFKTWRPD